MRAGYLQIGDAEVYSEEAGEGEPVLLLHGGFGSLESVRMLCAELAEDHRVFAYERPGHGRSADVEGDYSYRRSTEEAMRYLDAQGLDRVDVVGYSDGGIIGLMLAMADPERVRSLVAMSANLDPSAFTGSPGTSPVLDSLAVGDGPDVDAELLVYQRLSPDGAAHAEVVLGKLQRMWAAEPRIAPAELAEITSRTLIISGDRDTVRPDHSLLMAASIAGAQLCIVPGATHDLLNERPALVARIVREFVAGS